MQRIPTFDFTENSNLSSTQWLNLNPVTPHGKAEPDSSLMKSEPEPSISGGLLYPSVTFPDTLVEVERAASGGMWTFNSWHLAAALRHGGYRQGGGCFVSESRTEQFIMELRRRIESLTFQETVQSLRTAGNGFRCRRTNEPEGSRNQDTEAAVPTGCNKKSP